jgi:hypothetical protein
MPGLEDQAEVFCTTASPTLLHLTFQIAPNRRGQEAMAVREKPWGRKTLGVVSPELGLVFVSPEAQTSPCGLSMAD